LRIKRPDQKNAESLLEAARSEMEFTLTLPPQPAAAATIVRNIYECFRMLGDALLVLQGKESANHIQPLQVLLQLDITTSRPLQILDHLRRLRHQINYYGYQPSVEEAQETLAIARSCFQPVYQKIKKEVELNSR